MVFASVRLLLLMGLVKNITDRNTDSYVADNGVPAKHSFQVIACAKRHILGSSRTHLSDNCYTSLVFQTTEAQGISF